MLKIDNLIYRYHDLNIELKQQKNIFLIKQKINENFEKRC